MGHFAYRDHWRSFELAHCLSHPERPEVPEEDEGHAQVHAGALRSLHEGVQHRVLEPQQEISMREDFLSHFIYCIMVFFL